MTTVPKNTRRKPQKKSEPVPLKWMFLIPAVIAAALWIGYQLNEPGAAVTAPARGNRAAAHTAAQTDGGATNPGTRQPAAGPGAHAETQARADSSSSKAEDTRPTERLYIM